MKESDVKNIVDDVVRGIVEATIREKGFKEAMAGTIWMNEEMQIPIKKVRCYTSIKIRYLSIRKSKEICQIKNIKETIMLPLMVIIWLRYMSVLQNR